MAMAKPAITADTVDIVLLGNMTLYFHMTSQLI